MTFGGFWEAQAAESLWTIEGSWAEADGGSQVGRSWGSLGSGALQPLRDLGVPRLLGDPGTLGISGVPRLLRVSGEVHPLWLLGASGALRSGPAGQHFLP